MQDEHKKEHAEMLRLIRETSVLTKENNVLLKKIHRHNVINLTFKIVWLAIIIGLPFAVYFYVLGPYFEAFGANYEVFRQGMAEIPGLKGIENVLPLLFN